MSTNYTNNTNKNRGSFTLIELLVVLALVAILSVVVVMTLNPAELLKQARDSNRLSDLATINTALNLFSSDVVNGFMGTSTVVYISIPDSSPTCANLGLPRLPTSTIVYTYNCVTAANLRKTDGTGWIPVNFQRISSNSPISQLPIDPVNTTSTRLYYAYVAGGSWELNASIEASKNKLGGSNDLTSKDGGSATSLYEIGNNLSLNPLEIGDSSLVGYWNFNEGSGIYAADSSGNGNNGTSPVSGIWELSSGCKLGACIKLSDGQQVVVPDSGILDISNNLTISFWIKLSGVTASSSSVHPITKWNNTSDANYVLYWCGQACGSLGNLAFYGNSGGSWGTISPATPYIPAYSVGTWVHVALSYSSAGSYYINGVPINPLGGSGILATSSADLKFINDVAAGYVVYFDDVRMYNRALSAAEILAIYNANK